MWTNVLRKCVVIPTSEPFGFLFYTPWNKGSDYKVNLKISILRLAIDFFFKSLLVMHFYESLKDNKIFKTILIPESK